MATLIRAVARDVIPLTGLAREGSEHVDASVDPAGMDNEVRLTRGDSTTLRITVYNADGSLKDLSNWDAAFAMMLRAEDPDEEAVMLLKSADLEDGADDQVKVLTQTGDDVGVLEVYLTPTLMQLVPRSYVYSVTILKDATDRHTVVSARFVILRALVETIS